MPSCGFSGSFFTCQHQLQQSALLFKQGAVFFQQKGMLPLQVLQGDYDLTVLLEQSQLARSQLVATAVLNQRRAVEAQPFNREAPGWRQRMQSGIRKEKAVDRSRLPAWVPQHGIARLGRPVIRLVQVAAPATVQQIAQVVGASARCGWK